MADVKIPRQKSWPLETRLTSDIVDGLRKNKSLRFADSEGLPLVTVVNISRSDSCDSISSMSSTTSGEAALFQRSQHLPQSRLFGQWSSALPLSASTSSSSESALDRRLRFEQRQPSSSPDFQRTLQRNLVSVENVAVRGMSMFATVRVRNIAYEKHVAVRYTLDNWASSKDVLAAYVKGSCDGPTDRFSVTVPIGKAFPVGSKVQFAVNFRAANADFWDNNGGLNYSLVCEARTSTSLV